MPRKAHPHTKAVRAKGKSYVYFRTGQFKPNGTEILARLPDPGSPQFGATYAALLARKTRRHGIQAELTVPQLCDLYEASQKFTDLSKGTKRIYRTYLDRFRAQYTTAPAGRIEKRDVLVVLDKMAGKPGAANLMLASIAALYKWGRDRHVDNDPCKGIDGNELGEHEPWPEPLLQAALTAEDDKVRLATHLLYYAVQRIGDTVRMAGAHVRDGAIHVTQEKTGKSLVIPLHANLRAEIVRHPPTFGPLLRQANGRGYATSTLRDILQKFASDRGYKIVPHGLRKNGVIALLEAGCSVAETAAISGQTLQLVEHYARRRNQVVLGSAAILKWEKKHG